MTETATGSTSWDTLERWSATAFLIGGLLMVVDAAFVATNVVTGTEDFLLLG